MRRLSVRCTEPSGTRQARTGASARGRRRRAWPGAGPGLRRCRAATATRTMPSRLRCAFGGQHQRAAPQGSLRKPSPMPSTRARSGVFRTRSVMSLKAASRRKPLRGNAGTVPCETVHPGAANSRVRRPNVPSPGLRPSAAGSPRAQAKSRITATLLGRGLVEAVQHDGVTVLAPSGQPFHGRGIASSR